MTSRYSRDAGPNFNNGIKNVALVGTTGQLGKVFVEHILKTGKHNLTAITRAGSNTNVPEGAKVAAVDYNDESSLVAALTGQDFLVITLALTAPPDTHSKLVRAAAKAGVPYIMPNAYGIDFYGKPTLLEDIPALQSILSNVKEVEEVGAQWIGLTPSFWFEYSLGVGPFTYGFDFPNKSVTFFDDGKTKVNTTTWPQRVPDDESDQSVTLAQFVNKPVYISSFRLNQREMLNSVNAFMKKTDDDWKISYQPAGKRSKEGWEELAKGDGRGFLKGMYSRVFQSPSDGVYETHNDLLGLPKEDLAQAVQDAHNWSVSQRASDN
ncbi:hypothetical protein M409DRAFT_66833 [Zasmidium cellare ATCC 36951]|uniref:NAD(P)-binding domain-containing protein n=1 Tax=Zasmidium cellare ATCC 36951 TaxID=1080233 RepID=A0A6A6CKB0_ZASCE|nr:uncharacterized protein M409DRAFT_66833 [Zasmidium cellare ATCC 36951]KAF2166392.1 hypothetical protein M409DRAFT_66833 [Zasmidium cellare ATCC 36951]